jgi:hypothetical protein
MSLFEQIRLLHPGWRDILEVALVSFAIYRVLLLVHRTRAMQVLFGIIVLAITYGVAYLLHLAMIVYSLTLVFMAPSRCSSCSRPNCAPPWRRSASRRCRGSSRIWRRTRSPTSWRMRSSG